MVISHPWITEPVFIAGMYAIAWEHEGSYLPEPATALAFFEAARGKVEREIEARATEERLALAPPRPPTPEVQPSDPYSSTPKERERWAKEDAGIRAWAARLGLYETDSKGRLSPRFPVTPQAFEKLSAADRDQVVEQHRRDVSVSQWPSLKPIERRAKEARIVAERDAAPAIQEAAAKQQKERRLAFLAGLSPEERKSRGGLGGEVVEVRWKDTGEVSRVELTPAAPPFDSEERRKERREVMGGAKGRRD